MEFKLAVLGVGLGGGGGGGGGVVPEPVPLELPPPPQEMMKSRHERTETKKNFCNNFCSMDEHPWIRQNPNVCSDLRWSPIRVRCLNSGRDYSLSHLRRVPMDHLLTMVHPAATQERVIVRAFRFSAGHLASVLMIAARGGFLTS